MPTAARLFAALMLAATAWLASVAYASLLPEGTPAGLLAPLNAAIGALVGWRLVGRSVDGQGYGAALGHGAVGAAVVLFWALVLWSGWSMLGASMRRRYDGIAEALEAVFGYVAEHAALMLTDPLPAVLLFAGGLLSGLVAEWAKRRYR